MALPELTPTNVALLASELLSVLLGLAIAYVAYRGYQRNNARPMLFLSVGFLLAFGLPSIAAFAWGVFGLSEAQAAAITQTGEVVGFASVLYGLRFAE